MKIIDIIIFTLCATGLIYFMFDRLKYTNMNVYREKLKRLNELRKLIALIENEDRETEKLIWSVNLDADLEKELADRLIGYRDNDDKLSVLKDEQRKIEKYIKNFRIYNKHIGMIPNG